jgi:Zn-dependent peptidase ImmA (M78 family)
LFDALVAVNDQEAPGFAVDKERDSSAKFALCRGLFEYFNSVNGHPLLVTREQTRRQQRNRAFAAEFLAPSELLTERVSGRTIDEEEVEDIAEELGVSSYVVDHQLDNHQIVDEVIS